MSWVPWMYWPTRPCQGEGCIQKISAASPSVYCPDCMAKKQKAEQAFPDDPEAEAKKELFEEFRLLKFTESEARQLAEAWADPTQISWWLEQGCTHRKAVAIAT